jgi:hypothetical protein
MAVNKNFIVKRGIEVHDSAVVHGVLTASGLRYPVTDGNYNDVVKTNGSGILSLGKLAISDLSDVNMQSLQDEGLLVYDSATSKWIASNEISVDVNSDGGFY